MITACYDLLQYKHLHTVRNDVYAFGDLTFLEYVTIGEYYELFRVCATYKTPFQIMIHANNRYVGYVILPYQNIQRNDICNILSNDSLLSHIGDKHVPHFWHHRKEKRESPWWRHNGIKVDNTEKFQCNQRRQVHCTSISHRRDPYSLYWWNKRTQLNQTRIPLINAPICARHMMTSSNENIFRVTGLLYEEFTGHRWIPHTKASGAELWCFLWSTAE